MLRKEAKSPPRLSEFLPIISAVGAVFVNLLVVLKRRKQKRVIRQMVSEGESTTWSCRDKMGRFWTESELQEQRNDDVLLVVLQGVLILVLVVLRLYPVLWVLSLPTLLLVGPGLLSEAMV